MRLAISFVALAALLGAVALWTSAADGDWASTRVLLGVALGLLLVVGMVGVWWRGRQRRRLANLRDSALW